MKLSKFGIAFLKSLGIDFTIDENNKEHFTDISTQLEFKHTDYKTKKYNDVIKETYGYDQNDQPGILKGIEIEIHRDCKTNKIKNFTIRVYNNAFLNDYFYHCEGHGEDDDVYKTRRITVLDNNKSHCVSYTIDFDFCGLIDKITNTFMKYYSEYFTNDTYKIDSSISKITCCKLASSCRETIDTHIVKENSANYRNLLENAINDLFKENKHIKDFFLAMIDTYVMLYEQAYAEVKANPATYLAQTTNEYKNATVKYQQDVDSAIKGYEKENAILREKLNNDLTDIEKGYNDRIKEITDIRNTLQGYLPKPKTKRKKA